MSEHRHGQREIISLQVGGLSNWVGAHLWNLDGDDRSAALYSESGAPRLAAFDLRGRRGSLFAEEEPPPPDESSLPWSEGVSMHETELHPRSAFRKGLSTSGAGGRGDDGVEDREKEEERELRDDFWDGDETFAGASYSGSSFAERARALLKGFDREKCDEFDGKEGDGEGDGEIPAEADDALSDGAHKDEAAEHEVVELSPVVWSDFLEERFRRRSLVEVPLWDVRSGVFSSFGAGDFRSPECALGSEWAEGAEDTIRILLEDCDACQGFTLICDAQGGFGGLASALAAEVRDHCRSAPLAATLLLAPPPLPTDRVTDDELVGPASRREARQLVDHTLSLVSAATPLSTPRLSRTHAKHTCG